jgi:hypothetical protein
LKNNNFEDSNINLIFSKGLSKDSYSKINLNFSLNEPFSSVEYHKELNEFDINSKIIVNLNNF